MKCPKCGAHLKGYEAFCPECGTDLMAQTSDKANYTEHSASTGSQDDLQTYLNHFDQALDLGEQDVSSHHNSHHSSDPSYWDPENEWVQAPNDKQSHQDGPQITSSLREDPAAASQATSHFSSRTKLNYFRWWWQSIRRPLTTKAGSHYSFAWISFLVSLVLWIFSFRFLINRFVSNVIIIFTHGSVSPNTMILEHYDYQWWALCTLGILALAIYWSIGYLCCNGWQSRMNIWQYGNRLASLTNVGMIFSVIMLGLALSDFPTIALICFTLVMLIDGIGLVISVFATELTRAKDKVHLAFLAVISVPLLVFIIFECILQIIS